MAAESNRINSASKCKEILYVERASRSCVRQVYQERLRRLPPALVSNIVLEGLNIEISFWLRVNYVFDDMLYSLAVLDFLGVILGLFWAGLGPF